MSDDKMAVAYMLLADATTQILVATTDVVDAYRRLMVLPRRSFGAVQARSEVRAAERALRERSDRLGRLNQQVADKYGIRLDAATQEALS